MKAKNKAILYLIISSVSFSLMNVFVRLAGDIPTMQKSFFRNAISLMVAMFLMLRAGTPLRATKSQWGYLLLRAALGTVGVICNFYAVDHMLLSDASMLNKLSPFFMIISSFFMLHERITIPQSMLVITAFMGSLFIIKPSFSSIISGPALIATLGGICAGVAYTTVRMLGNKKVQQPLIIFVFSAFSCLVTLPSIVLHYTPMDGRTFLYLLLAGLAATGGQFGITAAYCYAPASEVSVYDYLQVLFAAIFGYFVFGQVADHWSFVGYFVICLAAVCMFLYNQNANHMPAQKERK